MRKICLLIMVIIPLFVISSHAENRFKSKADKILGTIFLVDTVYAYSFDITFRCIYSYNEEGYKLTDLRQKQGLEGWEDSIRISYTYGINNAFTSVLAEVGKEGKWENLSREKYELDERGFTLFMLQQSFEGGNWIDRSLYSYTNDDAGNPMTILTQYNENGEWVNEQRIRNGYDEKGNNIVTYIDGWRSGEWQPEFKDTSYYNEEGKISNHLESIHNGYVWEENSRDTYIYENGKLIRVITEINIDGWEISNKVESIYNAEGRVTGKEFLVWSNNSWVNADGFISFFDDLEQFFGFFAQKISIFYKSVTGLTDEKKSFIKLYPNPVTDNVEIKGALPINPKANALIISDLQGREIERLEASGPILELNYNTGKLPNGSYLLNIVSGDYRELSRFVINR